MSDAPLPEDAFADVAYLARSENRIRLLRALTSGPHTPRDLQSRTDIPRSTLERIVTELEEREWARRAVDGYTVTAVGERVVTEFVPFVETMEAIRTLGETVDWLPDDAPSIPLGHFRDATVRRTDPNSPVAEATYLLELLRTAETFRALTYIAPPLALLQCMRDGVVSGRLTAHTVLTDDLLSYLRSKPEQTPYWQEFVDGGAGVYRYEGDIPCTLFVVDETVLVGNNEPAAGHPCEFIETTDRQVRSWADDLIGEHRTAADRLTADAFTDDRQLSAAGTS